MYALSDACDTCSKVRMASILQKLENKDVNAGELRRVRTRKLESWEDHDVERFSQENWAAYISH